MEKVVKGTLLVAVIVFGLHMGASMDREDHAILTMSETEYKDIRDSLATTDGGTPSDGKIADEWYARRGE